MTQWEICIGLEIHIQLKTGAKLFSDAPFAFGHEPNTLLGPVCTGQPGALPTLNQEAVEKGIDLGLALGATIAEKSYFDRKSYFYPDTPQNYQITQHTHPLFSGGALTFTVSDIPKTVPIERGHLENDTAMMKHFDTFTGIDYNRAGAPLIELVTPPVIDSAETAMEFVYALRELVIFCGISEGKLEDGSMRIDANCSVRMPGEHLGTKCEIKNMNSAFFLKEAIHAETQRQIALLEQKQPIVSHTYRWDADARCVRFMREKKAKDYRYFKEPDLPPLIVDRAYIAQRQKHLPMTPHQKRQYLQSLGLSPYQAKTVTGVLAMSNFFDAAYTHEIDAGRLCNWITIELLGRMHEREITFETLQLPPHAITTLVRLLEENKITGHGAKILLDRLLETPTKTPEMLISEDPALQPMQEDGIEILFQEVVQNNQQSVHDYLHGNRRAEGFLIGQIMKATKGRANPPRVAQWVRAFLQQAQDQQDRNE